MAETPLPFGYTEDKNKPTTEQINLVKGGFAASRHFLGSWDDRFNFVYQYLMQPIVAAGGTALFAIPNQYPDLPLAAVDNVSIRGEGIPSVNASTGQARWERARITANYKETKFNFSDVPQTSVEAYINNIFIEEESDASVEVEDILSDGFTLDDSDPGADDKFQLIVHNGEVILKQQYVINPLWIILDYAKGKTNYAPFITPGGAVYGAQTLLYEGYSKVSKINVDNGSGENFPFPVWELVHRFAYRKIGWNKTYHKKVIKTVRRGDVGATDEFYYPITDFFAIFFGTEPGFAFSQLEAIQTDLNDFENLVETSGNFFTNPDVAAKIASIRQKVRELGFRI
ncbi:MAG: hypothetical protein GTO02_16585 [Candidatus Dadabacteria bacterium]|nr:hypothetical protein [Candidatus Dadabacteria bacterium]